MQQLMQHTRLLARVLSHHNHQQQQLVPQWDALCQSLLALGTAAAAGVLRLQPAEHQQQWAPRTADSHSSFQSHAPPQQVVSANTSTHPAGRRARVLDGKAAAAAWSAELQQQVQDISRALNRRPGLAVVLVGNRPDSLIYVSRKQEACKSIGIHCRVLRLPDSVSQANLQACVAEVSADRAIDGVLVQLPLPPHLDEEAVMEALDPRKDVDGFHPLNMGRMLMRGRAPRFVPATPLGVVELLSRSDVSLAGKTAVVLGDSNIVGTPIAALLRDAGVALVTTCHRVSLQDWFEHQARRQPSVRAAAPDVCLPRLFGPTPPTEAPQHGMTQHDGSSAQQAGQAHGSAAGSGFQPSHLPAICRTADILVVAVGSPELIRAGWVKPGAVVVDVGINVVPLPQQQPQATSASSNSDAGHNQQQQQQLGQQQQQQQQQHSGMQVAQGSMPASGAGQGPEAPSQPQQPPALAHSRAGGCKPEVQLQLVQSDADGSLALSSDYSVVGDVAHEEVAGVASVLTPVPGGVGPMTIAAVLHNTLQAARYSAGLLRW